MTIEHPSDMDMGKFIRKWKTYRPTDESMRAFDEHIARENAKALVDVLAIFRAGNIQIEHVTPEITREDEKVEFDTDMFFQRCDWARRRPAVYSALRTFERREREKGFYLVGASGCGKTSFAKTYAFQLMKEAGDDILQRPLFVKFLNFGKLLDSLAKDNWIYKHHILEQMRLAVHLFIDDLGSEKYSEFSEKTLFDTLDSRLHKKARDGTPLRTYFTSNIPIKELPYHDRIQRRLQEISVELVLSQQAPRPPDAGLKGNPTSS